jgi:hypothetical protein
MSAEGSVEAGSWPPSVPGELQPEPRTEAGHVATVLDGRMNSAEMHRHLPFPFPGGTFPATLGAVVQRTVLDRIEPARLVLHDIDGDWAIGDGANDPNLPNACIATHIAHVLTLDPTIAGLATLPPGHQAERETPADEWQISAHTYGT